MVSIDADIREAAWADRMLMQLEPYSQDEATWRAGYSEDMITELLDRARVLLEVRVQAVTQLPALPGVQGQEISPTEPYYQPPPPVPLAVEDAALPAAGEHSTLSSGGEAGQTVTLSSDIEAF